jgi:hypothetical protein
MTHIRFDQYLNSISFVSISHFLAKVLNVAASGSLTKLADMKKTPEMGNMFLQDHVDHSLFLVKIEMQFPTPSGG